jgi:hypothetical protein
MWGHLLTALLTLAFAGPSDASVTRLPSTTDGIHIGVPFVRCYQETWFVGSGNTAGCNAAARTSIRTLDHAGVDVGWMWTYNSFSPSQTGVRAQLGAALNYDRFQGWKVGAANGSAHPLTLDYWTHTHPDWISYTCATDRTGRHTTPAWEFGAVPSNRATAPAYLPFDITNSAARRYLVEHYVKPSIDSGYRMVFFDNFSLSNFAHRCGHYDRRGRWKRQYSGSGDPRFAKDVIDWLRYLRDAVHRYKDSLLAINYNPIQNGDSPTQYQRVFDLADVVWSEGGFTSWGKRRLDTTSGWTEQFEALRGLGSRAGKGLIINGIVAPRGSQPRVTDYSQFSSDDIDWVLANYLLVKGAHTYTAVTTGDYGYFRDLANYHVPIGKALEPAFSSDGVWMRTFTNGLAIVNPDGSTSRDVALPPGFVDTSGRSVTHAVVGPTSGVILLRSP